MKKLLFSMLLFALLAVLSVPVCAMDAWINSLELSWEPSPEQPVILLHWVDESGNYVSVPADYQEMANGMHVYSLQITDPFVLQNRLSSVAYTVTNQGESDQFMPDPSVGIDFSDRLDEPVLITNMTQMRSWILFAEGATSTSTPPPIAPSSSARGVVVEGCVIKADASTDSNSIDTLSKGENVEITRMIQVGSVVWYELSTKNGSAYITSRYIDVSDMDLESVPKEERALAEEETLAIKEVDLYKERSLLRFKVRTANYTAHTIDAFDVIVRAYNSYDELLVWHNVGKETAKRFSLDGFELYPQRNDTMYGRYWDILGWGSATRIEVAVARYHTLEAGTITIDPADYVWVEGKLK